MEPTAFCSAGCDKGVMARVDESWSTWMSRVTYEYSLDESCCSSNADCDMCHQVCVRAYSYVTSPVALGRVG